MAEYIIRRLLLQCALALIIAFNAWGYKQDECMKCHGSGGESKFLIDAGQFMSSVHAAEIECIDCHTAITGDEHYKAKGLEKVDCGSCHEQENVHGDSDRTVQCIDCHTSHAIYRSDDIHSSLNRRNLKITCGACHPGQINAPRGLTALTSFRVVSHPKQDPAMIADMDMCTGCHQGQAAHGEKGAVSRQNCYKCHSPLDENKILFGYMHPGTDWKSNPVAILALFISLAGLIGVILLVAGSFMNPFGKRRDKE